jgi:putative transposase
VKRSMEWTGYKVHLTETWTKTNDAFSTPEAARKLLYLATQRITRQWNVPIREWAKILNRLAIRFEGRFEL